MFSGVNFSTTQLLELFTEEITARQGEVLQTFDDGQRLFVRSVLPLMNEVRPGDIVKGGVALKAAAPGICIYPYVFRQVCTNGAILAHTLGASEIEDADDLAAEGLAGELRTAIAACCEPAIFANVVDKLQAGANTAADMVLTLMPLMQRFARPHGMELIQQIMERFLDERDRTQFGLANIVTAIARDTRDPERKWDLEEFGGGIAIGLKPRPSFDGGFSEPEEAESLVAAF